MMCFLFEQCLAAQFKKWIEILSLSLLLVHSEIGIVALLISFSSHIDLARKLVHKEANCRTEFSIPFFIYTRSITRTICGTRKGCVAKMESHVIHTHSYYYSKDIHKIHAIHKCIIYTNVRLALILSLSPSLSLSLARSVSRWINGKESDFIWP